VKIRRKTILPRDDDAVLDIKLRSCLFYNRRRIYMYRQRSKYGVCACVWRRSNFITAGEEHTRRSENECNSLKDANKQCRRLLHPETHKHEFPTSPPYPSYYCQKILIILLLLLLLILYYIFSVLLLLTRRQRRLCPTCSHI